MDTGGTGGLFKSFLLVEHGGVDLGGDVEKGILNAEQDSLGAHDFFWGFLLGFWGRDPEPRGQNRGGCCQNVIHISGRRRRRMSLTKKGRRD